MIRSIAKISGNMDMPILSTPMQQFASVKVHEWWPIKIENMKIPFNDKEGC